MEKENYSSVDKTTATITVDKLITESEFSYFPLLSLLNAAIAIFLTGMEMNLYIFLLIPYKNKMNYGNVFEEFCASSIFFGFAIGAFAIGYITNVHGRVFPCKICSIGIAVIHLILMIFLNKVILFIFRFLMGFLLGAYVVIIINIFSEYRSNKNRNFYIALLWAIYQLGCFVDALLGWWVMPNYERKRLRGLLAIYLFLPVCAALLNFFTIYDSPSNLILNGDKDNAFIILKSINKDTELSDDEQKTIQNDIYNSSLYNSSLSTFDSVKNNASSSIVLYLSILILAGAYYGILILTPNTKARLYRNKENVYNRVVKSQVLIYLISLIFSIAAAFLILLKILTKKLFLMVCFVLAALVTFFAIFIKATFSWLIGIYTSVTFIGANILVSHLIDFHKAKTKDLGSGFQIACYMGLCAFSQIWMLALYHVYFRLPYILYCVFCCAGAILVYLSPFDDVEGKYSSDYLNPEHGVLNKEK
jgi:MFS family permease